MRQILQCAEVEDYLVVVPGIISDGKRDVLFGGSDHDGLVDQLHCFFPDWVFDLVTPESEDTECFLFSQSPTPRRASLTLIIISSDGRPRFSGPKAVSSSTTDATI